MKFDSNRIVGLFNNEGDLVGKTVRNIRLDQRIVVSQGFGVSEGAIPLRFLAYIVPVLHLLKQLPRTAIAEFYFAVEGVKRANPGYCPKAIAYSAKQGAHFLQRYVKLCHPDVANQIRVLRDRATDESDARLTVYLAEQTAGLYDTDSALRNFVDKRGGFPALRYMAEHALYMRDPLNLNGAGNDGQLVQGVSTDMDTLIMVGGPAEKIFYRVRQHLCAVIGTHSKWQSHQLWTPIGDPPTYHPQNGEPTMAIRNQSLDSALRQYWATPNHCRGNLIRDFLVFVADAAGRKDFRVSEVARKIESGQNLDAATLAALSPGWEIIRSL
jgi:hypothetical protein